MSNSDIDKVARKEGETLAQYIPRLGTTSLEFQPGSRWTYSPGAGFETLGRIVEIVSGMPLDKFFRQRIFDPLGMKDIAFWPTDAQWTRVASVYQRGANGLTKQIPANDTSSRGIYFRASGGLYSTAEDYIPFGVMLANMGEFNGKHLLGRKTVEMMTAAHVLDTLARTACRRRLWVERPRRDRSHAPRNDVVRRNVWMVRRTGHPLLRRSERETGRRADGADQHPGDAARLRGPRGAIRHSLIRGETLDYASGIRRDSCQGLCAIDPIPLAGDTTQSISMF